MSEKDEDVCIYVCMYVCMYVPGVFDNKARTAYVGRLDPAIWGRIWID